MKYSLILGIEYVKYKNPATVLVHTTSNFIDSFELDRDHGTTSILSYKKKLRYSDYLEKIYKKEDRVDIPKFYKIYKVDEQVLNDELIIEILNSNSDATNGFMKRSSLVKLRIISLIPSDFVEKSGQKLLNILDKFFLGLDKTRLRMNQAKPPGGKDWIDDGRYTWPTIKNFHILQESKKNVKDIKDTEYNIGGTFKALIPIRRKHGIHFLGQPNNREIGFFRLSSCFPTCFAIIGINDLLNTHDENQ